MPMDLDTTTSSLTSNVGTPFYVSPEVLESTKKEHSVYTQKVDVFSLGIVFFEMLHPFATGMERADVLTALRQKEPVFPKDFEKQFPKQAKLIFWMLTADPDSRPTTQDILKSDLMPTKMEDAKILEVLKTVTNPNTSWRPSFPRRPSASPTTPLTGAPSPSPSFRVSSTTPCT